VRFTEREYPSSGARGTGKAGSHGVWVAPSASTEHVNLVYSLKIERVHAANRYRDLL
jgi:hypothetical protein